MSTLVEYLVRGAEELQIELDEAHLEKFSVFAAELIKWNRKINLTAITRIEEIAIKHFIDSIVVMRELDVSGMLLDIGSGGGFPAIPLKIVLPQLEIVSVDAVEKKVLFQRHIARLLHIEKFTAMHSRVEDLAKVFPEKFNWIVSRAFSDISTFVQLSLPLLADEGVIIAMKGKGASCEVAEATDRFDLLGVSVTDIRVFQLPLSREERSLVMFRRKND